MMGLLSTRPIMEKSVDDYDDAMRLQDLQIYSSYGFDEADVRAVREAEFVDEVFASRFVDCYAEAPDGTVSVVRAEEADRPVNRYELVSGRLPQAADECLFLSSGTAEEHYPLGSKVKLFLEDEDLTEKLKKTEYTVVGTVKSPAYLAFTLGTGTMKNLDLDTALYLPNENFHFEYYTSIYLTVKDAAPLDSFSSEYDVFMDDARGEAEALAIRQQDQLKGRLIDEYSAEIAKGEAELEKQKQEGQEKLDAARKELDDANIQLVSSRTQLESLNAALSEAEARQSAMVSQVNGTTGRSMNRIAQIEEEDPEKREFTEIFAQLTADYGTYNALKQMRDAVPESTSADALATARAELASLEEQIAELSTEEQEIRDEMTGLPARLQEAQARLAEAQARLAEAEAAAGLEWPDAGQPGDATGDSDGDSDGNSGGAGEPGEGQTAEDVGGSSAGSGEAGESGDQQADQAGSQQAGQAGTSGSGSQQAEEARQEAEEAVSEAEALIDELTARQEEIGERLPEVETELAQLEAQAGIYRRLVESYEQLEKQAQTQTLDERIREIEERYDGDPQATYLEYSKLAQDKLLNDTMQQEIKLVDGAVSRIRGEIESAVAEIDSGTAALEAGELEYRRGEIEFNVEIEKAEAEIRKAYQELEELPDAKWTILDRSSHYSSYLYKNNAAQMGAIGIALPVLFYLVAALVCMTTMTRLVDEQRGQIGVFRALGFSRARVAWKYVVYALLATLIGTVLGIGFGMMLFPSVIYRTWRLMYDLPHMEFFMPLRFMLICFLAFAVLMALVTWFVVQKTLAEVPSQLLRPKAPKSARRIFLERFTGIWNHISFTGKITARNLMRYKARFIMTVIGVAGCTGLLVVGWGIKDSISDVVAIQYGEIFNYNYIVSFEEKANVDELMAPLQADLDNEYVAPMLTYSSRVYLGSDEPTANIVCMNARDCNDVYHLHLTDRRPS
ncbi:MAG: ABC transporter permease [Firmicutes bacterium]|nr:ABC transporter permease [Bacillota bacterium]